MSLTVASAVNKHSHATSIPRQRTSGSLLTRPAIRALLQYKKGDKQAYPRTVNWCGWRDSNSHAFRHWYLKPACLPIPPHPLTALYCAAQLSTDSFELNLRFLWRNSLSNSLSIRQRDISLMKLTGVDEGVRTLDRRNHNPELYQLSYAHQQSLNPPDSSYLSISSIPGDLIVWRTWQDSNLRPSA